MYVCAVDEIVNKDVDCDDDDDDDLKQLINSFQRNRIWRETNI